MRTLPKAFVGVGYKGRLDLFSNYKNNPKNIDLYMTNMFITKLSKVLQQAGV